MTLYLAVPTVTVTVAGNPETLIVEGEIWHASPNDRPEQARAHAAAGG